MENPWKNHDFNSDGNILKADLNIINEFNKLQSSLGDSKNEYYRIHEELFPAPFMGDVFNAKIILLMLNPGYEENEASKNYYSKYRDAWIKHITSQPDSRPPLFCFEKEYIKDSDYWYKKLIHLTPKHLSDDQKFDIIKHNVAVIQYMPYHSLKFKNIPKKFYKKEVKYLISQEYNFYIVNKAIERNALILVLRGKKLWEEAIPLLDKKHGHVGYTNSPQNITLTEKNLGEFYPEVMKRLYHE